MRNLTIQRRKSFVGCLGTMKVYIEDMYGGDTVISGTNCRMIGTLKNGEMKTFQIDDYSAKVFVIGDKLTKNMCNDFYQLPEGCEDIALTGKNTFNPMIGNPYQFDGVQSREVADNRKKNNRKGIIFITVCFCIGVVIGLASALLPKFLGESRTKEFSSNGLNITLTENFKEVKQEGFTVAYEGYNVAVMALKEPFTLAPGASDLTLQEYGNLVIEANSLSNSPLKTVDGITCFEYEATPENTTYYYFAAVYKADDAFWLINFAVKSNDKNEYYPKFVEWAKSVNFD